MNQPVTGDTESGPISEPTRWQRIWKEWRGFTLFIIVMLLFRSAIADWNHVPTGSMIPSILEGDRIVVDKLAYDLRVPFTLMRLAHWSDPQRSDVITFESPVDGKMLVKRVIGVPGDIVEMRNNHLIINGEPAQYGDASLTTAVTAALGEEIRTSYEFALETSLGKSRTIMSARSTPVQISRRQFDTFAPVTVPQDRYLVLGDNRDNSQDSRFIGFVDRNLILGKANHIAFSLDQDNWYIPRTDRFFQALN
jgi:signal peptidase I